MKTNIINKTIGIIIQARMGSSRLPGKVLLRIDDKSVLGHIIMRLKVIQDVDFVVATTNLTQDDLILEELEQYPWVKTYRGDSENVMIRYLEAAKKYNIELIIRITADCPLIDPHIINQGLEVFLANDYDIVTNAGPVNSNRTFPRGLDFEIFSTKYLESISKMRLSKYDKEHVTPAIYRNSFKQKFIYSDIDNSDIRITLDTIEDYRLISKVYENLYKGKHDFFYNDVVLFLRENSDIINLNRFVKQKEYNEQ
jgi:spore coat polysaccharide biosynthesis protein SpsF